MKDKKELKTNLISSFLILLSCCLAIALLINLKFQQDCATVIVGMLGVCAALFAPIAAYYLLTDWKEQYNTEIEQRYINDFLIHLRIIVQIQTKVANNLKVFRENLNQKFDENEPLDFNLEEVEKLRKAIKDYNNLYYEYSLFSSDVTFKNKNILFRKDTEILMDLYTIIGNIIEDGDLLVLQTVGRIEFNLNCEIRYDFYSEEYGASYLGYYYNFLGHTTKTINDLYTYILKEKVLAK